MKPRLARVLLTLVLGIAALEWVAAARAYRDHLDDHDWKLAAEAIAPLHEAGEPVFVANEWLRPLARSRVAALAAEPSVAAPDLRATPRFHVLGFDGRRWSNELQVDLEDLPVPHRVLSRRLGDLTLTTYEQPAGRVVADLTRASPRVTTDSGPCTGRGPWKCKEGRVGVATVEVDYRPRHCIGFDLSDGVQSTLEFDGVPKANRLRGHVGFSDFNGRLRSDAPAVLTLERSGAVLGRWVFADEQGWQPFAVALAPDDGPVTLRVRSATRGTWGRSGYAAGKSRPVCIELRALAEDT